MVVMIHAGIVMDYARVTDVESMFWRPVSRSIAYSAMPTLFFISGFLLAQGWSYKSIAGKMVRRFKRLVVPYVLWNLAFVLLYLLTASFMPSSKSHVEEWHLTELHGIITKVVHPFVEPCDAPFWYIRSLIYFLIFTPLVFPVLKRIPWVIWCAVLAWLGFNVCDQHIFYRFSHLVPPFGVASFILGAHLALRGHEVGVIMENRFLLLSGCLALAAEAGLQAFHVKEPILMLSICRFLAISPVLKFSEALSRRLVRMKIWKTLVDASFFIYASHVLACSFVYHVFRVVVRIPVFQSLTVGVLLYFIGGLCLIIIFRKAILGVCPKLINIMEGRF